MALEQRRFVSPYEVEQEQQQREQQVQQSTQLQSKPKMFSLGEKCLFVVFASLLTLFASVILQREAQLNTVNREVQAIGVQIEQTEKQNTELSNQVKANTTYEKIWEKAKELGLNLNEKNVKVVPGR